MKGIQPAEVSLFFRRMHTMLAAGISIPDSLTYLERAEANPAFRKVLGNCVDTLIQGRPVSACLGNYPDVFPHLSVEMVANGERTGALAATLGHLATLQERALERRQRIKAALSYPLCLLVVMLVVVCLFVTFVAPGDEGLFSMLGDEVPWPSRVLIQVSAFLTSPFLLLTCLAVLGTGVLLFRRAYHERPGFRLSVDTRLLELPAVGRLLIRLDATRSLEVLASAMKVGIPLVPALQNAIRVVSNERFRQDLQNANLALMEGVSLGDALQRTTRLPRFATALIAVGEESGELEPLLQRVATIMDDDVNDALSGAVALVEPILLCLGGLAAGFVAVATFLPIMRLLSHL